MEEKGAEPLPEPETPPVNRSVPRCFLLRETGFKQKTNSAPTELQWAAEDGMVTRNHEEFRCQLPDVTRSTFLVVFSPDGKKVASTHGNHNVYVTDLTSGKNIKTLTGHPRTPWCIAFHPSSNQILASGCLGGQVRVWDLSGGSEIWMAESQTVIASLAFHPVDRMLVIASYNELHFWDWSQPEPFAKCFTANEKEKVRYVAFDALGHKLITGVANVASRPASQWDRVAAPLPPPLPANQLDSERRITICYRYMVEQYEQLVQRYYDLSRARSTLTMDRGTDPMELEGESSESPNTTQGGLTSRRNRGRRLFFYGGSGQQRTRLSSGTDEASASHSSTNFLTPPEPNDSPPVTQPLLASSSDPSTDSNASEPLRTVNIPRRNLRFDITLPSFTNFRSTSPSTSTPTSPPENSPSLINSQNSNPTESTRNMPFSALSSSTYNVGFGISRSDTPVEQRGQNDSVQEGGTQSASASEPPASVQQLVRNLVSNWCTRNNTLSDGTSTEVPSGVDSENDDSESFQSFPPEALTEDESEQARPTPGVDEIPQPSPAPPRDSESSAHQFSEASAVSQLRTQFHRLQSVYENRNNSSNAHVFSPETQAAGRRLLNRLNAFLDRPVPEPRARRMFASRRSAFQPRPQPPPSVPSTSAGSVNETTPDIIGGVRYGIQLLSRHIDNMQRLCRARLEILQLQQIRRMWEDLQSQIYALHGAVRDGRTEEGGEAATQASNSSGPSSSTAASSDLLTDDDSDGPSSNGELHWRLRRTPQTSRRNAVKTTSPRTNNRNISYKRTRLMLRPDLSHRVRTLMQSEMSRRQLNQQPPQRASDERAEASSSQETSTGTSDEQRTTVRGVKRKSRDHEPLFRLRPSMGSTAGTSSTAAPSSDSTSSLAAVMRETIVQLENMVFRHRQSSSQRNSRQSRFTRQREERMMRHLWDTESSHESSRDDQSEGDSPQQSAPGGADNDWTRDSTRSRARQVLLLMVDSLTQFFENDNLSRRTTNEALNDRINNLYVLLQLALNLTDLLLAQLVNSRREMEGRRPTMLDSLTWIPPRYSFRPSRHSRHGSRNMTRVPLCLRRIFRRYPPVASPSPSPPPQLRRTPLNPVPTPPPPPPTTTTAATTPATSTASVSSSRGQGPHRYSYVYSNIRSAMMAQRHVVPIVRVNDLPPPPPEAMPSPRYRHSPPPMSNAHPPFTPPRFLHPTRYMSNAYVVDESTSEDSSSYDRSGDVIFLRAGYGTSSVFLSDTSMAPHHRIQAWDFSKYKIPDLGQAEKNVVVSECKIHNDASVDMSKDGRLLVTLLPSGRLSMTTLLGIYSLQWSTLGQLLYTTSLEQSIVSVSLSPTSRHLVVGLASRRVAMVTAERHTNAQVFRLEGASPGRKGPLGAQGRLVHLRDLELSRQLNFMSLNCIRWAPNPGQGLVYGTNTGHLKILR